MPGERQKSAPKQPEAGFLLARAMWKRMFVPFVTLYLSYFAVAFKLLA